MNAGTACLSLTSSAPLQLLDSYSFVTFNNSAPDGHQVIFTGAQFNCHGYITGWSALTVVDVSYLLDKLTHRIHMQVWRPVKNRTYQLVGTEELDFNRPQIINGLFDDGRAAERNFSFFNFSVNSVYENSQSQIYFQPGDVIGYISGLDASISPLYTHTGEGGGVMLVSPAHQAISCVVRECTGVGQRVNGVTPHIRVNFGEYTLQH